MVRMVPVFVAGVILGIGLALGPHHVIASTQPSSSGSSIYFQHLDHLSGQGVTTDANGRSVEVNDYYPYGSTHTHDQTTSYTEQRKFDGQPLDTTSGLYYLGE